MNTIPLSSLRAETFAAIDYFGQNGELLIPKGTLITRRHLVMLEQRNNFDLFINPAVTSDEVSRLLKPEKIETPFMTESERVFLSLDDNGPGERNIDIFNLEPGKIGLIKLSRSRFAASLDDKLIRKVVVDRPLGPPLKNKIVQISVTDRTETYKNEISGMYRSALQETKNLLRLLVRNNNADAGAIEHIVKQFLRIFITDRNILLNISGYKPRDEEFIFHHSLNVCLLAINVAASYGYNEKQILEIGMGAIVHDIGMLLIPSALRMKQSRLTEEEWCEIQKHPILGLHLLQNLKNMPERIPFITFQVHERENSSGYPRQRQSILIHRFAKMVQVADIYEALTSLRPHRPAYMPSDAMRKIVQMSQKKLIPIDTVRAFVEYVSLFPVGSLVELHDHRIAKVIQANKEALDRPVISVLIEANGDFLPHKKIYQIDLSQNPQISILRSLPLESFDKLDIMDGF